MRYRSIMTILGHLMVLFILIAGFVYLNMNGKLMTQELARVNTLLDNKKKIANNQTNVDSLTLGIKKLEEFNIAIKKYNNVSSDVIENFLGYTAQRAQVTKLSIQNLTFINLDAYTLSAYNQIIVKPDKTKPNLYSQETLNKMIISSIGLKGLIATPAKTVDPKAKATPVIVPAEVVNNGILIEVSGDGDSLSDFVNYVERYNFKYFCCRLENTRDTSLLRLVIDLR